MKSVLKESLFLTLAVLALSAIAMIARVRADQLALDADNAASLPPTITAGSVRDLFPH
jgi:hypothetical protein